MLVSELSDFVEELIDDYQRPRVKLDRGNGDYRLRTLVGMARWAQNVQPIQPKNFVRVTEKGLRQIDETHGWYPFIEDFRTKGPFEVYNIGFNGHTGRWYAVIFVSMYMFEVPQDWLEKVEINEQSTTAPSEPTEPDPDA